MVTKLHADTSIDDLLRYAKVKNKGWPNYTINDHVVWMLQNLKDEDLHCTYETNQIEAYMNIMPIVITINSIRCEGYGCGNLCAYHSDKSRAYGAFLMKQAMEKIANTGLPALSFCHYDMMTYYRNLGWRFIHRSKLWMPEIDTQNIRVMVYNCDDIINIEYYGKKL